MVNARHGWLNPLEISAPFLVVPVLCEVFPQGLEELNSWHTKRLRSAYDEWRDAIDGEDADRDKAHAALIDEVQWTGLEADDHLLKFRQGRAGVGRRATGTRTTIASEFVFVDPAHGGAVLAPIHVFPPDTDLSASMKFGGLAALDLERYAQEAASSTKKRSSKVRAKAAPDGQGALALVDAPEDEPKSSKANATVPAKNASTRRTSK